MGGDLILYQFSRMKVERGDFSHFVSLYSLDKLPAGRKLRQMMNSMIFCIDGYDHDPREIHSIPEVRKFYSAFHAAWPYWLYFCNLDADVLKTMVLCCMQEITALKVDGNPKVRVQGDPAELMRFLGLDFVQMNLICERADMFEGLIYDRSKAVFEYFGFPYDAPRPD